MLPTTLPDGSDDPGLVMARSGDAASAFIAALARHRHFARETDPPGGLSRALATRASSAPAAARRGPARLNLAQHLRGRSSQEDADRGHRHLPAS